MLHQMSVPFLHTTIKVSFGCVNYLICTCFYLLICFFILDDTMTRLIFARQNKNQFNIWILLLQL